MTNLILGTDGRKMSSSWGNTINLMDSAQDMHGKVMTIPDAAIVSYFTHCTRMPLSQIEKIKRTHRRRKSARCKNAIGARNCHALPWSGCGASLGRAFHFAFPETRNARRHSRNSNCDKDSQSLKFWLPQVLPQAKATPAGSSNRVGSPGTKSRFHPETFVPALTHEGAVLKKSKTFLQKFNCVSAPSRNSRDELVDRLNPSAIFLLRMIRRARFHARAR